MHKEGKKGKDFYGTTNHQRNEFAKQLCVSLPFIKPGGHATPDTGACRHTRFSDQFPGYQLGYPVARLCGA